MLKYLAVLVLISGPVNAGCQIGGCSHIDPGVGVVVLQESQQPDVHAKMLFSEKCPDCIRGCSKPAYDALCWMRKGDTVWEGMIAEKAR